MEEELRSLVVLENALTLFVHLWVTISNIQQFPVMHKVQIQIIIMAKVVRTINLKKRF